MPRIGAITDVIASSQCVASAAGSVGTTVESQWVSGSQNGWNWIHPETAASTVRIATGTSIVHGPSLPWWR